MLAIILVAMIPGLFAIGKAMTVSIAVIAYLVISIALLILAVAYIAMLYKHEQTHKSQSKEHINKSQSKKVTSTIHMNTTMAKIHSKIGSKISSIKISDDKAERYIVAIVGLVGVVAILVMILR
jgi:membrane protein implicated in regulation of membrane protease activity